MKVSDTPSTATPTLGRREWLSRIAVGLASLALPPALHAAEQGDPVDEPAREPIGLPLVMALIGHYELRPEWLFKNRVLIEKQKLNVTMGPLAEGAELELVEHWMAREIVPAAEIRVENGCLELHTNFVWCPPGGHLFVGPGAIFSARIDGERQTTVEGRGVMKILRSVEQDSYNVVTEDRVTQVQEWWYRRSSATPFELSQVRRTSLSFESPGMLVLDLYFGQAASPFPREMREALHFRKVS
jgi:hypothetical protein